jgi:hypothetical protein
MNDPNRDKKSVQVHFLCKRTVHKTVHFTFFNRLKPCRGDLTRTDDPLHPMQDLLTYLCSISLH